MRGAGNSTPMSDQVPELMYAQLALSAGTAATAEPVSWEAGAMTGTGLRPVSAATAGRRGPWTVQGATAEQGEIDAPGVHPQAVDAPVLRRTAPQPRQHLAVEPQHVPVEAVEGAHAPVGEAVDDFQLQLPSVEESQDPSAALGAEIEG